jgi:hypothetical protein
VFLSIACLLTDEANDDDDVEIADLLAQTLTGADDDMHGNWSRSKELKDKLKALTRVEIKSTADYERGKVLLSTCLVLKFSLSLKSKAPCFLL